MKDRDDMTILCLPVPSLLVMQFALQAGNHGNCNTLLLIVSTSHLRALLDSAFLYILHSYDSLKRLLSATSSCF